MTLILLAGVTMFLADIGQGIYVVLMGRADEIPKESSWWSRRKHKLQAGLCDGLSDVCLALSVATAGTSVVTIITEGSTVHFGLHLTPVSLGCQLALVAGSVAGAATADYLTHRNTKPQPEGAHQ